MICPICKKKIEHGSGTAIAWEHVAGEGPRSVRAHHDCVKNIPDTFFMRCDKHGKSKKNG